MNLTQYKVQHFTDEISLSLFGFLAEDDLIVVDYDESLDNAYNGLIINIFADDGLPPDLQMPVWVVCFPDFPEQLKQDILAGYPLRITDEDTRVSIYVVDANPLEGVTANRRA